MNQGYIKVYRRMIRSRVFQNEGLFKVWMWCLLKASYKGQWVTLKTGRGFIEVYLEPGQFVFGRQTAAKELKMKPSTVWKRIKKLENMRNLNIESNSQYSLITIINWSTYQEVEKEGNSQSNRQGTGKEHIQESKECKKKITPEVFSSLRKRYNDQELIDQAFDAIRSTRKTGKVADSVLLAQLRRWEHYPVEQVEAGIRVYLDKGYAAQGKREDYLYGIIRNQRTEASKLKNWMDDLPDL